MNIILNIYTGQDMIIIPTGRMKIFRTGRLYDAHLIVRGGDARARYSLSGGYLSNNAIIKNAGYSRFNFRFNSVVQVSPKFDIGFNLGYTNGQL